MTAAPVAPNDFSPPTASTGMLNLVRWKILSSRRCAVAQLAKFRIAGITRGAGRTDAGKRSTAGRRQEERRGVWVVAGKLRDLLVLIAQAVENAVAGSDNQLGSELVREAKS